MIAKSKKATFQLVNYQIWRKINSWNSKNIS